MNDSIVCPWCQSEIVWDVEIGPESTCPHCDNELSDYRTLKLDISEDETRHIADNLDNALPNEDLSLLETQIEDAGLEDVRYAAYEDLVQSYLEQQNEAMECTNCGEEMVCTGRQEIGEHGFEPFIPNSIGKPFLKPPYTVALYVCPSCFQLRSMLSEEDRMALIESHLNERG